MRTIQDIEALRAKARIPKKELCEDAGIHVDTYRRWMLNPDSATTGRLRELSRTLDRKVEALRSEVA